MKINILQSLVFIIFAITCIPQQTSNDRSTPGTSPSSHPPSPGLLLNDDSNPAQTLLEKRGFISWITGADAHRRMEMEANRRKIKQQNEQLRQVENYQRAKRISEEANRRNIGLQNERLRQLKNYEKAKLAMQQKLKLDIELTPLDPLKEKARIAAESEKALANLDSSINAQTQILQSRLSDTSIAKPFPSTTFKGRTLRPSDIGLRPFSSSSGVASVAQKAPKLETEFNVVKNTISHLI